MVLICPKCGGIVDSQKANGIHSCRFCGNKWDEKLSEEETTAFDSTPTQQSGTDFSETAPHRHSNSSSEKRRVNPLVLLIAILILSVSISIIIFGRDGIIYGFMFGTFVFAIVKNFIK